MNIHFQISLPEDVAYTLRSLAQSEKRTPRDQVAWIVEKELIRQGLLKPQLEIAIQPAEPEGLDYERLAETIARKMKSNT